jgi:hypothetical protein
MITDRLKSTQVADMSIYLRGDSEGSNYLRLKDPQGRTFRKWADKNHLPFSIVGSSRIYRKTDVDRCWIKNAFNLPLNERVAA